METQKLDNGQKHIMRLIQADAQADGWTVVSDTCSPLLKSLPAELIEQKPGFVRLTEDGKLVLQYL